MCSNEAFIPFLSEAMLKVDIQKTEMFGVINDYA